VRPGPSKRLGFLPGKTFRRRLRGRAFLGKGRTQVCVLPPVGIAHIDEVDGHALTVGHLQGTWSFLGQAAGAIGVGVTRIQVPAGGWSTPAHDHGVEEELFYVLGGRGLSWHKGETFEIGEGDCILYRPRRGPHTLHALEDLDVLAFGPRVYDE